MLYKPLENFKKNITERDWESIIEDLKNSIEKILSEFDSFFEKNIALSILSKKDKTYLKRSFKGYIRKYLLRYPDEKYVNLVYKAGERLFLRGFSEEIILEVYKIISKSIDHNQLLKEKLGFDFSILLRPFLNFSLEEETKIIRESTVEVVFSMQEAAQIHIKSKHKFLRALMDEDFETLRKIPYYEDCEFSKWLRTKGIELLENSYYSEVENLHKLFYQKLKKIVDILLKDFNSESKITVYMLLKDLDNISLKLLFILNKISLENISSIALKDPLTGLLNRYTLDIILTKETSKAKRYDYKISLIIMDLDNFKKVNDTYGHLVGDEVLIHFAKVVKSVVRNSDYPFRYGGEEFLILLPHTDLEGAKVVAERIREKVEKHKFPMVGKMTVSCGIAEVKNFDNPYLDIERADKYLYIAKKTGKNKCIYEDTTFSSKS
ncbi:MAG: GGDEF domain-containing protein [Sulfurihydrogenibium sp.]